MFYKYFYRIIHNEGDIDLGLKSFVCDSRKFETVLLKTHHRDFVSRGWSTVWNYYTLITERRNVS